MKTGQLYRSRIFKPYQYATEKPDAVFIGSSRVQWGLPSVWPNDNYKNVYNYGVNGIHIPEEILTISHLVDIHKPDIMVIGVDLNQFSAYDDLPEPGFSEKRFEALKSGPLFGIPYALSETVFNFDAIQKSWDVVQESKKFPHESYYQNGFFRWKGDRIDERNDYLGYLHYMWKYYRGYRKIIINRKHIRDFTNMVEQLEAKGTKVIVFVFPYSADFLLMLRATGAYGTLERLKLDLSREIELLDFAYINAETINRANYIDGSHFRMGVGKKILARMASDLHAGSQITEHFGIWLNKENAKSRLSEMKRVLDDWSRRNPELFALLSKSHQAKDKKKFKRRLHNIIQKMKNTTAQSHTSPPLLTSDLQCLNLTRMGLNPKKPQ